MKSLADGVGDSTGLTSVKDRGTWGEYSSGDPRADPDTEQYAETCGPKREERRSSSRSSCRARASRTPPVCCQLMRSSRGKTTRNCSTELRSRHRGSQDGHHSTGNACEVSQGHPRQVRRPTDTTDFAIMFLPTEGLYAEVLRQPGLHDELQTKYRVLATGRRLSRRCSRASVGFRRSRSRSARPRSGTCWARSRRSSEGS